MTLVDESVWLSLCLAFALSAQKFSGSARATAFAVALMGGFRGAGLMLNRSGPGFAFDCHQDKTKVKLYLVIGIKSTYGFRPCNVMREAGLRW